MEFQLPAGTILKHGTRSGALKSILADGLKPQGRQTSPRSTIEPPPLQPDGCYVGWFMAYFGACASWAEFVRDLTLSVMKSRRVPAWFRFECPVVVEFELREPVEVTADEDFVPLTPEIEADPAALAAVLAEHAGRVWEEHRSCVVRRLPAEWVRGFEFIDMRHAPIAGPGGDALGFERLRADLHTLTVGVVQQQRALHHDEAMEIWRDFVKFDPGAVPTLSCRVPIETAHAFLDSYPLFDPRHRIAAGLASIWTFEEMGKLSREFGVRSTF